MVYFYVVDAMFIVLLILEHFLQDEVVVLDGVEAGGKDWTLSIHRRHDLALVATVPYYTILTHQFTHSHPFYLSWEVVVVA